ncbi:MAG TPA: vitamin K epoxide reductase family protein [Nitrospiria bacterium]|nr:vitamin K epoxide reductase family protein [Nitrospiria bacterium]
MSSEQPSVKFPRWVPIVFLLTSLVGFADSTYLTVKHYSGTPLECTVFRDCEKVTSSSYAVVGGVPLALYGTVYYLVVFLLSVGYLDLGIGTIIKTAARITLIGFGASIVFVYLQLAVIKAVCPYCMVSAATSTILFLSALAVPGAIPLIGRR